MTSRTVPYNRYTRFYYRPDLRFKLKKKILRQTKFVRGKEVVKNRILHVPVDMEFHDKLLRRAYKYYWHRSRNSFGSIKGVRPNWYVNEIAAPDLQIQCDIEDCFPSINSKMATKAMNRFTNLNKDKEGKEIKYLITKAAFVQSPIGDFLAQGVPISPLICNTVLTELDLKAEKMLSNEISMFSTQLKRLEEYTNEMYKIKEIDSTVVDFITKYTESLPTIKYSRYVDNIALSFWNFADSFHHLRQAKMIESKIIVNPATALVKTYMRCRERVWFKLNKIISGMQLILNKDKTKFRRRYGKKAIHFVGYTLNERPRAKKTYIENLRCKLHNYKKYLQDCKDGKAILTYNPGWLRRVKGECVWVFTCDPMHRRISKCLRETIELEKTVLGSRILASLERYLG